MDFKIIWSDAAIADLQDVCSYVALHDPQAAGRIGRGILDHVRILATFPFIGPAYPRGARGYIARDRISFLPHLLRRQRGVPQRRDSPHLARGA